MTRREATIVSAYTGYLIGGLDDLYNCLSELIGNIYDNPELMEGEEWTEKKLPKSSKR